jgi:3-hydroxybutyrate dehydrogenase
MPSISRKVLVTGGTGSVGQAIVRAFVLNQDRVTFQYCRDEEIAKNLGQETGAKSIRLDFSGDFILPEDDFDVIVNNAGVNISDVPTHEVTSDIWHRTIQINLTAPFYIVRQCLPSMLKKHSGRIINISSIYGLRAAEGNFPYTVSKHGLAGLTKTIAKEYAGFGITCNEICPGPIDSNMMREIGERAARTGEYTLSSYLAEVCKGIPAKRMAKPQEVAALAIYLASPQAEYINGVSIPIDGALIA